MRILAVDPGEKRIGIAVSDPLGWIASPLTVIHHVGREADAAAVAALAREQQVEAIVFGQSVDDEGNLTVQGRRARNFGEAVGQITGLPVLYWDEAFSTQDARAIRLKMGAARSKRGGHLDDLAAAVLLQSYLDAQQNLRQPNVQE